MPDADDTGPDAASAAPRSKAELRLERLAARGRHDATADGTAGGTADGTAGRTADLAAALAARDAARTELLVAAFAGARCLTCYVSVGREPDTTAVISQLAAAGCRVLLPRLRPDGGLDLVDRGPLVPGLRGIPAPSGPAVDPALAEVWLIPALAVDRRGVRLGRGGGAYDRVLPADRPVVALLHAGELVDALPAEPHDRPVTQVALPHALLDLPLP